MNVPDFAAGGVAFAIFAVFWFERDYASAFGGMFPDPVLIVLGGAALMLMIRSMVKPHVRDHELSGVGWIPLGAGALTVVVWGVTLPYLGFVINGALFFFVLALWLRGPGRWKVRSLVADALTSILLVGALYMLFTELLRVRLPPGILG